MFIYYADRLIPNLIKGAKMELFNNFSSVIFWDFKRKDNVNYNFEITQRLIENAIKSKDKKYYYKPIYLLLAAIIECTLYDFLKKINEHRYEQVPNLSLKEISAIQDMSVPNKFSCFNKICEKHSFLGADKTIYKRIERTAEIRNRIHIQNVKISTPRDESKLWTASIVKDCGRLLKEIFEIMCERYPRPDSFHDDPTITISDFPTPWEKLT